MTILSSGIRGAVRHDAELEREYVLFLGRGLRWDRLNLLVTVIELIGE